MEQLNVYELQTPQFRSAMNNSADILFIIDPDAMQIIDLNDTACRMTGFTRKEILAKKPHELKPLVTEQQLAAVFKKVLENPDEPLFVNTLYGRKDGSTFDVEISLRAMKLETKNLIVASVRDITERKKAELEVKESEQRLSRAEKMGNLGHGYYNIEKKELRLSDGLYKLFGVKPRNFSHTIEGLLSVIHPGDKLIQQQAIDTMFQNGEVEVEFRILRPDGEVRNVLFRTVLSRNINGEYSDCFTTALDITDRKKAEELVIKEKELSDSIINTLPGIFYIYDDKGKFLRWNKNLEIVSGYSSAEISSMTPLQFFEGDEIEYIAGKSKATFINGKADAEAHLVTKDRKKLFFYFNCLAVNYDDKLCAMGTAIDITDRKKAEEELHKSELQFRTLFEQATDCVMLCATDGSIVNVNSRGCVISGYSLEELLQMNATELFFEEDIRKDPLRIPELLQGKTVLNERRLKKKDGTSTSIEINSRMITDGRLLSIVRDISERKKEEEKKRKEHELQNILAEFSKAVSRAKMPEEIYELALTALQNTIGAHKAAILLFDDTNVMRFVACRNLSEKYRKATEGHSPWRMDERNAEPIFISEAAKEPTLKGLLPAITEEGIFALGFIPLVHQQQLLGKFMAYFTAIHHFTEEEIQLAQNIAGNVAFAIWEKRSQIALRESEAKYRAFFENSLDGILLTSIDGKIFAANPAACAMFEMTEKEICKAGRAGIVDLGSPKLVQILRERQQKGKAKGELILIKKDGSKFPAEISSAVFTDSSGDEKTSMIIRDITERKKAEEEIRRSQQKYSSLMDAVDGIVWEADAQTFRFSFVNKQAERLLGYPAERWINEPAFWSDHIHPDDKNWAVNYCLQCTKEKKQHEFEYRMIAEDGRIIWLRDIVSVVVENDIPVWLRGIMIDITERKKAEKELEESFSVLEATLESTADGILVADSHSKIVRYNKKFADLWHIPREILDTGDREKAIDFVLDQLKNPEDFLAKVKELYAQPQAVSFDVLEFKDGRIFERYSQPQVVKGQSVGRVWSFRDISVRKEAEKQLQESEMKYRNLVDTMNEGLGIQDKNGMITFMNQRGCQMLGYHMEELIGKPAAMLFDDENKKILQNQMRLRKKGGREKFEITWTSKQGEKIFTILSPNPLFNEKGEFDGSVAVFTDITERIKAEEEIVKTNARFQIVSKATSDIVWDWNISKDFIGEKGWYNDNYYNILGIEKKMEMVETSEWCRRIHPDDFGRVRKGIEKALSGTATIWRDEYRFAKDDGTYLDFLDRGYILRKQDGEPYRMIGSMVDMTPVYNAQKEVADSENRLRTIYESEPECIKLLSKNNVLLDMNPAGLAMIEADNLEQVKGKSILGVITPRFRKPFAKLTQDVFEGKPGTLEFELTGLKGTYRWMETHAVPLKDASGKIISLLGITRDVTERKKAEIAIKQSEEKYRTLVEQAADSIALYNAEGKILDVNRSASVLLGYTRKELSGMTLAEILLPEDLKEKPIAYDVLQKGQSTVKQRRMRRKDGVIVETEVRSQQLPDGRFLSVVRDMTDRIKAERDLAESYKAIRKLTSHLQNIREKERANIAREVHDELGQQLTVLKMDVSWLNKKFADADEKVKQKMKDLLAMLDGTVKSVRRISSELRPSLLDDLGLVAAMEWQINEFEKRSGIKTNLEAADTDPKLPDTIKTSLFRIFQESLTNVARHSGAKKLTVKLQDKENKIILMIKDDGKGFDEQKARDKKTLGILGMRERTSMIDGTYEITSKPGKGTTVMVTIPLNEHS